MQGACPNLSAPVSATVHAAARHGHAVRAGRAPARSKTAARGFSLLETTIAISILGIGLIMVAAVFPVALLEHRDSVYQARATALASKAEAMLRSRLNPNQLWVHLPLGPGTDSPWHLLPTSNLFVGSLWWDAMVTVAPPSFSEGLATNYAYVVSGATESDVAQHEALRFSPAYPDPDAFFNSFRFRFPHGLDILGDRSAPYSGGEPFSPFTDAELMNAQNHVVWFGFYRRLANGAMQYAVALCRQQRGQRFAEQDTAAPGFQATPVALRTNRRLPVPWRVTLASDGSRLYSNSVAPEGIGQLAPIGSKMMIQGVAYFAPLAPAGIAVPTGTVLTVSDVLDLTDDGIFNPNVIEVREDLGELPVTPDGIFDVWIIPPPVFGGDATDPMFGTESPVIDWKVFM